MKKLAILLIPFLITACNVKKHTNNTEIFAKKTGITTNKKVEKILTNEYIKEKIKNLQKKIDTKEITKDEAQSQLKEFIKNLAKLNDGSTESILQKIRLTDPHTADMLEKKIRENHPKEFEE